MKELLRIRNLSTDDTAKAALNKFRLQVFSGELFGLIGLNGSGKSTLTEVLSGEITAKSGQIFLDGIRFDFDGQKISKPLLEKHGVFIVKNENRLIGNLSISENMSILFKRHIWDLFKNPGNKEKLVELTLTEFFPMLNPDTAASELSPAVHWEIAVLKAYIEGARLILLDRIIEFCSDKEQRELFQFINILRSKGLGFVITYNKIAPFLRTFDRTGIVRNGKLQGIVHQADYNPKLAASLIIGGKYTDRFSIKKEQSAVGRRLLEVRDLSSSVDGEDTDLVLHSAEILGIYDPVQDASSTLMDVLSGASPDVDKLILVDGEKVNITEEYHAVRAGIGLVSDKVFDKLFFMELTAGENLAVCAARLSAGIAGHIPSAAEKYIVNKYLNGTGFPDRELSIPVKFIEKDLQFILALHMRILSGVKIFILENPVRGADLLTRKTVYQRIESLRKPGTGVIFISTDYAELDGFCDRIIRRSAI
ncbi:MAG: ATP-binding cassette domain-containing protein [Spirochaetales bacterium]|uniref:ATP-binding cassette domain-containing protein n=1 Tax=Candidatus Thalassospirochaeta sargassi TaxID=3119039 RepID=A0AAJ1IDQ7_9SPIO|nr:ATP-binding cassette domain-containing protein [Spirochaetales bacterium]